MILDVLFTGLLWVILMKLWQKHIKQKEIWVFEDSESDIMLLKINLQLDDYYIRYFKSVKGLRFRTAMSPPDAVICDYFLQDDINGDQVRKFFRRNHIPVIITTGYDGDINGVPADAIIRKTTGQKCYRDIEHWVHSVT